MEMLSNKVAYENKLNDYVNNEKAAVSLISSIGHLMYEKSIELYCLETLWLIKVLLRF